MRLVRTIAIAASAAMLTSWGVGTAAAQDFDERWSIIPKAHAEPAPRPPAPSEPVPQDQPAPNQPAPNPSSSGPDGATALKGRAARSYGRVFSGKASFYSYRTGKTADGQSFDRERMTAAHRSLPFGTKLRVTDVATHKSVVVSITDRGPNMPGRVLDLSLAAARSLGIMDRGVVRIRAEVL